VQEKWLDQFDWQFVTATNEALCRPKNALHKPASDGHEKARELWERNFRRAMSLAEAVDLCRECHRLAPFCNFNGNTFVALIRNVALRLKFPPDRAHAVRSWMGHFVAGTATPEEMQQFQELSASLTKNQIR
jgi:hypothetical protein